MKATVTIKEDQVRKAVFEYLKRRGVDLLIDNLKVDVGMECVGFGPSERMEPAFRGYKAIDVELPTQEPTP